MRNACNKAATTSHTGQLHLPTMTGFGKSWKKICCFLCGRNFRKSSYVSSFLSFLVFSSAMENCQGRWVSFRFIKQLLLFLTEFQPQFISRACHKRWLCCSTDPVLRHVIRDTAGSHLRPVSVHVAATLVRRCARRSRLSWESQRQKASHPHGRGCRCHIRHLLVSNTGGPTIKPINFKLFDVVFS
jgi:hypothetical protein